MFSSKPDSALIIVGHGSTVNPDSSAPTFDHAEEIARRGVFGEVHCAFWKEEPSLRQVLHMVDRDDIYVVPNFISEGYFTRTVIPRELELDGRGDAARRADDQILRAGGQSSAHDRAAAASRGGDRARRAAGEDEPVHRRPRHGPE